MLRQVEVLFGDQNSLTEEIFMDFFPISFRDKPMRGLVRYRRIQRKTYMTASSLRYSGNRLINAGWIKTTIVFKSCEFMIKRGPR